MQVDFIKSNMIEGHQQEMKSIMQSKLGIHEAEEHLALKYDSKTAEVLEASVFEQQMQMSNIEAALVRPSLIKPFAERATSSNRQPQARWGSPVSAAVGKTEPAIFKGGEAR